MKSNDEIVVAGVFETDVQAHIVCGVLQTNGIEAQVINETISSLLPFLPPCYRVLVNRNDLEKAEEIISGLKF
ncbi:MAG: DUF2007 domain-containing protein [Muribaculaceae bacterium]|nr:DUF2007 domain-containing protein [Muribaculaceae bacterium]